MDVSLGSDTRPGGGPFSASPVSVVSRCSPQSHYRASVSMSLCEMYRRPQGHTRNAKEAWNVMHFRTKMNGRSVTLYLVHIADTAVVVSLRRRREERLPESKRQLTTLIRLRPIYLKTRGQAGRRLDVEAPSVG